MSKNLESEGDLISDSAAIVCLILLFAPALFMLVLALCFSPISWIIPLH